MKSIIIYINTMNASGGIERVVSNLVAALSDRFSITILVKDNMQSFYPIPLNVNMITINAPLKLDMNNRISRIISVAKNFIITVGKLKKFVRSNNFDYIYTVTPLNSLEFCLADSRIMRKMVISEHASAFAVNGVYQKIKRIVYPKAYCVSVPNKMDCEVYEKWRCNTIYIPHLSTYKPLKEKIEKEKIILNVGRLTSDKRQLDLIEIWSEIKDRKGWKLMIVGSGEEKESLESEIKRLKLDDVTLIEHTTSIEEIYKKAAVFAFTSRMEGFGMVLLEAMSFGIPCISYDCPSGPRDIIVDGVNGYLIENSNKKMFGKKLQEVMVMSEGELRELENGALNTIEGWDNIKIVQKWKEVFE